MAWLLVLGGLALVAGAWSLGPAVAPRQARGRALTAILTAVGANLMHAFASLKGGGFGVGWGPSWLVGAGDAWGAWFPLNVGLIGLIALALSPTHGTSARAFRAMLLTLAVGQVASALRDPLAIACVASLAFLPVWWGLQEEPRGRAAARVFALHQLPSSLALPLGAALWLHGQAWWGACALALGLVLRKGLVPGQAWVPLLVERAPMGLSVCFLASHLSAFSLLRLLPDGLPPALSSPLLVLAGLTALLSAALATVQQHPRRALAFLWLHQSASLVLGLVGPSSLAQTGALLAWLVVGLAMAGFAMALVALEGRRGELHLRAPSGCWRDTPRLGLSYLGLGLATVGLPGTVGFVADDLLVQGLAAGSLWLGLAQVLATALAGIAVARTFFFLFMGRGESQGALDLRPRESIVFTGLLVGVLGLGLMPGTVVQAMSEHLHPKLQPRRAEAVERLAPEPLGPPWPLPPRPR